MLKHPSEELCSYYVDIATYFARTFFEYNLEVPKCDVPMSSLYTSCTIIPIQNDDQPNVLHFCITAILCINLFCNLQLSSM